MTPNPMKPTGLNNMYADHPNHPSNNPDLQPNAIKEKKAAQEQQQTSGMDGDHTAKTMDSGANAATNVSEMTEGIHEGAHQSTARGEKTTGQGTSIFSKDGAVGKQFTGDGNIGGLGNKVGGPLASDGIIGKQFEAGGTVGGTFQKLAEKNEGH